MQLSDDPRLTPLGLLLRSTHLDELPQLFNVLKGEMSLIGPRPIVDEQLHWYGSSSGFYLQVKPGITGLWQVSQRNAADNDHRVFLDCWYVKNWSLWRDWVILLRTVPTILTQAWAFMPKARSGKNAASAG